MFTIMDIILQWSLFLVGLIIFLYLLRKYNQGNKFKSTILANGKIVIVTGCNTGIGKETVLELARRGAKIYMACRNFQKCEIARLDIIRKTGNPNIYNYTIDLSSFESIREFVKRFLKSENRLDILINNAGIITNNRELSKDGYEMSFAVNHLGHFLLTNLLLDVMKSSVVPSRIINVSDEIHKWCPIDINDLQSEQTFNGLSCYGRTKLANILFTRELSKQLHGCGVISVNSVHPGLTKTDILKYQPFYIKLLWWPFTYIIKTPRSAAQTILMVSLDPSLEYVTGKYFGNCRYRTVASIGKDDKLSKQLWDISVEMTERN